MLDCRVTRIKPQIGVSGETSLNNLDPTMNEPSMERKGKNPTFTGLKIRVSVEKEQQKKIKGTGYSSKTDLAAALFYLQRGAGTRNHTMWGHPFCQVFKHDALLGASRLNLKHLNGIFHFDTS